MGGAVPEARQGGSSAQREQGVASATRQCPAESPTSQYFSRHYYDLAMLVDTEEGQAAATNFELLAQVARHKATFFRSSWSSYGTAQPGTLRLMPNVTRIKDLRADYREMAPMMFDEEPAAFDDILAKLEKLEKAINS